jgi:hypothetical protein
MRGEELQNEYVELVLDRITSARYPSKEMLTRAENLVETREQAERLVGYLMDCISSTRYPSHELMDRIERILFGVAAR